ncbi:cysteine proteinase [Ephemerocybe angulata]|uniref:Cysteine proteinase n=1 Tax=Ephemerocybe angulata TaxID=980116 RepID=A0A8H6MHC2_9AGAR|nr:cysteine proteinase [Tulosesus angulatus]
MLKRGSSPPPPKPYIPELDKLLSYFRTRDAAIDERLHPPRPRLPTSLPEDDEKSVEATFRRPGVIAKIAREQVASADIVRLRPRQWLNDEIINFYGAMIMARAEEQKENAVPRGKILKAFYLSSFFWQKLSTDGYEKGRLAKWTKKVDIFSRDVVLIPVNHGNAHWTAAAINFQKKRFESYDSMGMATEAVWKRLRDYVRAEHLNKKKKPFDFTGWKDWAPDSTPQQDNGYDCGVFTCQFLESLSRGEDDFVFTQEDMPYLRRRMVWEIAHTRLRNDV